jgi:Carboxypeptidase regulatory-like domain
MRHVGACLGVVVTIVFVVLSMAVSLSAQTASTSTVTGSVSDKTGATVPNAKVELEDVDTKAKTSVTTGSDGSYTFPSVRPGNYSITVSGKGFRQSVVSGLRVEVGKSSLVNVTLEVGGMTETVEVTAAGVQLQTLDATMGNVLDSNLLSQLPTLSRDATSLLLLQPMAIPGFNGPGGSGEGNLAGGAVAGARGDQNTFMIDGGDATSNMEGGGGYNTGFVATPRAVVPTPVESLEEFRVATNNAGSDFTRSAGAEVQMVTKRGTNDWHGSGYWYHQNDELNANDWFRNELKIPQPEWRDNRYGGKIGGPIWKNRTFFFLHEEERHFFTQAVFSRLSPTPALRAGIIEVGSCKSIVNAYNLNPIAVTDPGSGCPQGDPFKGQVIQPSGLDSSGNICNVPSAGCTPLDPRAGTLAYQSDPLHCNSSSGCISPAIAATWATMPPPNDYSGGDGLRTANFTGPEANTANEHFAVLRLDHKINDKWDFMTSYRYSVSAIQPPNIQEDISGTAPGCTKGVVCALATRPLQPRYLVTGLTGRLTPNLINEFHFDWLRHWWSWIAPGARIPVIPNSLSDTPLQIWRESRTDGMVPINVNTQQARQRVWNGQDYTWSDNLSWIKGKHAFSFGGRAQIEHFLHVRDDKVTGGITTPLYFVAKGGNFNNLGGIPVPSDADSSTAFKRAYISALGLVDAATQVLTRDGSLNPNPALTTITQKENVDAYEVYFGDTWRPKSSLTLTLGLTWGVQMPPYDPTGKTALMIDVSSGQLIDSGSLLNAKRQAALNGVVVNPTLGYVPIRTTGRKYPYDPDYSNFGPRVAVAWNPSFTDGFLGTLAGNKKSVIRAGWARAFDRINGVGIVLTPALGIGFGDVSVCRAPAAGGTVTPGVATGTCDGGGDPATNFRIGVDGNHVTVPSLPSAASLNGVIIPGINSVFENSDSRLDPHNRIGSSDQFDLSIQRELPGKMILELGYVGRIARNLFMNIDLNATPYMFTPKSAFFGARATNQTFAQAFDAVATQLQSNSAVTVQPWFEAMLGGVSSPFCSGAASIWGPGQAPFSSCTAAAVAYDQANGNPFWPSHGAGAFWALVEPNFVTGPMIATNTQVGGIDWNTNKGYSRYHAGFISLRKSPTHGLTFDLNYTFAHSLDNLGFTQENTCAVADAFDVNRTYAPSLFDRRHTFNLLVTYDLPLGKGKRWGSNALADKVVGGWNVSGVYTAASGLPLEVTDLNACASEFGSTPFNGAPVGLLRTSSGTINASRHNNPTINNFGTNSSPGGVPNAFGNPDQVVGQFRYPTFADGRLGLGAVRGLFRWNVDLALAKRTRITERVSTRFDVQFVNAFNHPMFGGNTFFGWNNEPNTDVSSPQTFGVLSQQFNSPRYIQMGLRFDF